MSLVHISLLCKDWLEVGIHTARMERGESLTLFWSRGGELLGKEGSLWPTWSLEGREGEPLVLEVCREGQEGDLEEML